MCGKLGPGKPADYKAFRGRFWGGPYVSMPRPHFSKMLSTSPRCHFWTLCPEVAAYLNKFRRCCIWSEMPDMKSSGFYFTMITRLCPGGKSAGPRSYVTWKVTEEQGRRSFDWGHYFTTERAAVKDFLKRAGDYEKENSVFLASEGPSQTASNTIPPNGPLTSARSQKAAATIPSVSRTMINGFRWRVARSWPGASWNTENS